MISVIVPAYNAQDVVVDCLAALQAQTMDRDQYEVIIVDDGSTDQTARVARADEADKVLVLSHRGPAAARNAGVRAANGEIVLFTDADCEPAADWIDEMSRPFANPEVVGVKGTYRTRQREAVARLAQCEFEERYDLLECRSSIDFVDSHAAAFRVEAFQQVGGFDPAFPYADNEDVDLSYRLAQAGYRLVFNRQAFVYHRHPATWRAYLRLKVGRGYWRTMVYRRYPGKALHDSYTPQLLKIQVLLVPLSVVLAVLVPIWPSLGWAVVICVAAFFLSAVPFTWLVAQKDPGVAPLGPILVGGRAVAIGLGVIGGLTDILLGAVLGPLRLWEHR